MLFLYFCVPPPMPEKALDPLELKLQTMSCHVGFQKRPALESVTGKRGLTACVGRYCPNPLGP